ncbi:MAG: methyl-accepting chemotaxis protein [Candidatus Omnitrophota bacterium]
MKWFLNLSTSNKLMIGFGMMIVLLLAIMAFASAGILSIKKSQSMLFERDFAIATNLLELRSHLNRSRADTLELMLTTDKTQRDKLLADISRIVNDNNKIMDNLLEHEKTHPEFLNRLQELRTLLYAYRQTRDAQQIPLIVEGKIEEAKLLSIGIQDERYNQMRDILLELGNKSVEDAKRLLGESTQKTKNTFVFFAIISLIAFLSAVGMVASFNRILAGSLKQISTSADRIASGDLSVVVPFGERRDEIGKLSNALSQMIRSLQEKAFYARSLIEASLDPLVTISQDGKITDVNEATIKITGISREKLIGDNFSNYFTEPEKANAGYREVLEKGFVTDYPLTIRDSSGNLTHVLYNASVYKDMDGKVLGVFAAARDITAQRTAEDALRKAHSELEIRVQERTADLTKVLQEVREGINVLSSSASEIFSAATQVASGAAETAASVSETTSTVEEVKQTAQVTTQKAKYVSESAQKTVQTSQTGKNAVEESIEGMNRIREQMESIADNILRLSEQSQTIGEIIAVVNDLADQSNLLAVNAAIEAAKAGEQGKGFGVVAQEVRRLAEQSKQSTAQVRVILNNIVKSVNQAAMATEQGSKAVAEGVKYAKESGDAIRLLAENVTEAFQAATQIAASIQQQLVGVDQVAQAMENINQVSSQNAASTKQVESAAQNLNELGRKLKELVVQYRG